MKKQGVALLAVLLLAIHNLFAQKKPLDFNAIDNWPVITNGVKIADNGRYIAYSICDKKGSQTTYLKAIKGASWQLAIPGLALSAVSFSPDSKCAVCSLPGDTLCIQQLGTNNKELLSGVSTFEFLHSGKLIYKTENPIALVIRNLATSEMQIYDRISDYTVNPKSNQLLLLSVSLGDSSHMMSLLDISSRKQQIIWKGRNPSMVKFDNEGNELAFLASDKNPVNNQVWLYRPGMDAAELIADKEISGMTTNMFVSGIEGFNADGKRLFFYLAKKPDNVRPLIKPGMPDVWNYKSGLLLPVQQFDRQVSSGGSLIGAINLDSIHRAPRKLVITKNNALTPVQCNFDRFASKYLISQAGSIVESEARIRSKDPTPQLFRVSLDDGSETPVHLPVTYSWNQVYFFFNLSPTGKWLVFFNNKDGAWYSYDVEKDLVRNLTATVKASFYDQKQFDYPGPEYFAPAGGNIAGWMTDDKAVLIYDSNDIWKIDPSCKKAPINLTQTYGLQHHLELRIAETMDGTNNENYISENAQLLLSAFDPASIQNGFYKLNLSSSQAPEKLIFGPYNYYNDASGAEFGYSFLPVKAKNSNTWIIGRCSATESPNLYATTDFKHLKALTDLQPQKQYNWLTTELVHWTTIDGKKSQGILYKPEDFDSTKKYPIIFEYYRHKSHALHHFPTPDYAIGDIEPGYYASHGYLVFCPDIYYTVGAKGESIVNCIVSVADYLSRTRPYIDSTKMGLNGSSFGGWETNYLVTHTNKFAAANECCGMSDLVMEYDNFINLHDEKGFFLPDDSYYGMGGTLWQHPERYIANSPIFNADKVTTPLLILHNKADMGVAFSQGVELFTALWELHKPAWLLQYDGDGHGVGIEHQPDYTTRQMQFFDHYLKGAPAPKWMTDGIPPWMKGIDDGLELEPGKTP